MMKSPRFITMSIGAPVLLALGMLGEGNGDAAAAGIAKRIAAGYFRARKRHTMRDREARCSVQSTRAPDALMIGAHFASSGRCGCVTSESSAATDSTSRRPILRRSIIGVP